MRVVRVQVPPTVGNTKRDERTRQKSPGSETGAGKGNGRASRQRESAGANLEGQGGGSLQKVGIEGGNEREVQSPDEGLRGGEIHGEMDLYPGRSGVDHAGGGVDGGGETGGGGMEIGAQGGRGGQTTSGGRADSTAEDERNEPRDSKATGVAGSGSTDVDERKNGSEKESSTGRRQGAMIGTGSEDEKNRRGTRRWKENPHGHLQEKQYLWGVDVERGGTKEDTNEVGGKQRLYGFKAGDDVCRGTGQAGKKGRENESIGQTGERGSRGCTWKGTGASGGEKGGEETGEKGTIQNGFDAGPAQWVSETETTTDLG